MQRHIGTFLLVVVLSLAALGLLMLASMSGKLAAAGSAPDLYEHLRRQSLWLVLGGGVFVLAMRVDYHRIAGWAWIGVAVAIVLMLACFIPGIGRTVKGATRWLCLMGWTVQPSELAKIALIVFLAGWLARYRDELDDWKKSIVVPASVLMAMALIVLQQHDLGSTFMLFVLFGTMLFCAGVPKKYWMPVPIVGLLSVLAIALSMPERRSRIFAFLDLEGNKEGKGYQVYQGIIALGSGGPWGLGLGNSRQKMYYLPEAHTDFIFPIIGEELGLWVALAVVTAFLVFALCGGWITLHAPDMLGVLLGAGATTLIALQGLMNLAVVTSLMPAKGVPLPFVSYGGSNLMVCLACVGLLFNIQRSGYYDPPTTSRLMRARSSPRM